MFSRLFSSVVTWCLRTYIGLRPYMVKVYIKERINDQTTICAGGVTGNTTYLSSLRFIRHYMRRGVIGNTTYLGSLRFISLSNHIEMIELSFLFCSLCIFSSHAIIKAKSFQKLFPINHIYIYIYVICRPRSVMGKTVPEVLSTARSRRPRAVLKTEGTVFLRYGPT